MAGNGRLRVVGDQVSAETLKWSASALLGFQHFLTDQLPATPRDGNWVIVASDKVQNWDFDPRLKQITIAQRVAAKVEDAVRVSAKVGAKFDAPFLGVPVRTTIAQVEKAVAAVVAELEKTPAEPVPVPAEPAAAVPVATAPQLAAPVDAGVPAPVPVPPAPAEQVGMSRGMKIALVATIAVIVTGFTAVGIWMISREAVKSAGDI